MLPALSHFALPCITCFRGFCVDQSHCFLGFPHNQIDNVCLLAILKVFSKLCIVLFTKDCVQTLTNTLTYRHTRAHTRLHPDMRIILCLKPSTSPRKNDSDFGINIKTNIKTNNYRNNHY